jgi:hypothetical protein
MANLTALDMLVLLLVGGGAVFGVIRGFVTEVISLFSWVAAIFALKILHTPVSKLLAGWVGTAGGAAVLAFALIFLVVFIAGKFVAASLGKRTRQSVLGPVDRVLGLGFGALKGCSSLPRTSPMTPSMAARPSGPNGCASRAASRCSTPAGAGSSISSRCGARAARIRTLRATRAKVDP